ncbi:armadillo-type protein [Zopfochytrium polystomum]|nr:armadillo-type protein [Zopfochytrium polystomum]
MSARAHQIQFVIAPSDRHLVAKWLLDSECAADLSRHFNVGQFPNRILPQMGVLIPAAAQNAQLLPSIEAARLKSDDDALEGVTVHNTVHLISVLGHHLEDIRTHAVVLLFDLALIFDKKTADLKKRLPKIALGFQADDKGFHSPVHELFHFIGPAFNAMAIALAAGLECFFTCSDWMVRGICISALARIIYENEKVFVEEDQLSAVWNLYFSLESIPLFSKVFPDRLVIIKSLGLLAPMYACVDTTLTIRVISSLIRVDGKTFSESEAIKSTVKKLFEKIVEESAKQTSSQTIINGYSIFLNILTPKDESAYDLLSWAVENYTVLKHYGKSENVKQGKVAAFPALLDFLSALSNHYRASASLVRYGASLSLHSCMSVCPTLFDSNKTVASYILSGTLDSDYLTSFLYTVMLETLAYHWNRPDIQEAIAKFHREDLKSLNYDGKFLPSALVSSKPGIYPVLELAATQSIAVAPKLLQRAISALDYLPRQSKIKQLELLRLWGAKLEKFDSFLVQAVVPLLSHSEEDIQQLAVQVMQSLMPSMRTAVPADINFIWASFHNLLNAKTQTFLRTVTQLVFHKSCEIRTAVYKLIGASVDFWKSSSLFNAALGVIFLSIGDQDDHCCKVAVDILVELINGTPFKSVLVPLGLVRDAVGSPLQAKIRAYDDLANFIFKERVELKDLVAALSQETTVDEFWNFFLKDAPENQLVRPDDYNYGRNFIHGPFWISLLLSKLSIAPPPLLVLDSTKRDTVPSTPANKRRFVCGFLLCLLPTCGMTDPLFRRAACASCVFACFKSNALSVGVMRGLLEYISQQMLGHKYWSFQLSAFEILKFILRLKLPGLSQAIAFQYLDATIDIAFNSPTSIIKIGALRLIKALLLVFPSGLTTKLGEIRDVVRNLIVENDQDVTQAASEVYPLVFRCVSTNNHQEFYGNLMSEITALEKAEIEELADPLLSSLTMEQKESVLCHNIQALGSIPLPSTALSIIKDLIQYLPDIRPRVRHAALSAIIAQLPHLDSMESPGVIWMLLPLAADGYQPTQQAFYSFVRKVPSRLEQITKILSPHPDDSYVINAMTWEELLLDGAVIHANSRNFSDLFVFELSEFLQSTPSAFVEDTASRYPLITQALMSEIKSLSKGMTGTVPAMHISLIMYNLECFPEAHPCKAPALLVLSELSCIHDSIMPEIMGILVNCLNRDMAPADTCIIEAAVLGLTNICEYSPSAFKQVVAKVISSGATMEGELIGLLYWMGMIRDFAANRVPDLLKKYLPLVSNQRSPTRKRIWCLHLCVELSAIGATEEAPRLFESIFSLLEVIEDEPTRIEIYCALAKVIDVVGPKHPVFRKLMGNCRKDLAKKDVHFRMRSLALFRAVAKHVAPDEIAWFCLHFLADSSQELRMKAKEILLTDNIFNILGIQSSRMSKLPTPARKLVIAETCKLSSVQSLGITASKSKGMESSTTLQITDTLNAAYFASDRRKKFTNYYGLPETMFTSRQQVPPMTVLEVIKSRCLSLPNAAQASEKAHELLGLDTTTILADIISKFTEVCEEIMETMFQQVEEAIGTSDSSEPLEGSIDIESEIHAVDVIANMLFAYDGLGDKTPAFAKRLQQIIEACNNRASEIREGLYLELEETLFFYNDYLDIPITSEEEYGKVQEYKKAKMEATMEIFKLGRSDKMSALDKNKSDLVEILEERSAQLRSLTILALHCASGYGLFYALSSVVQDDELNSALGFLTVMLSNEHRGIRITVVEAISTIIRIQREVANRGKLETEIQSIIARFLELLSKSKETLFRRKADITCLMAELANFSSDKSTRMQVLRELVSLWRDQDSEVRIAALKMTKMLGENEMPEVFEGFNLESEGTPPAEDSPPSLIREVAALLNDREYLEKD